MTHRLNRLERSLVVAVVLCLAVVGAVVAATGAPVAWFVLGINGALSLCGPGARRKTQRRFFEPLHVVAGVAFVSFFVRPSSSSSTRRLAELSPATSTTPS